MDFGAIVEHRADAECLLNARGVVLYANHAISRLLGRAAADLIGQNILDLVHAEDRPDVERRTAELLGCPGEYLHLLARVGDDRGGWRWVDATVTNLLDHQQVGALVVTLRDVTHERRLATTVANSEERLRLSTEAAELGAWNWDLQTNLVSWTFPHPLLDAQGGRSGTEPPDRLLPYVHPDDADLLNTRLEQAMIRGPLEARFRAAWPGAGTRWFAASGRVSYRGSRPARIVGTVRDITSTRHAWHADEIPLARSATGLVRRAVAPSGDGADAPGTRQAREEERRKLARELHDQMAQYITGLSLALEPLERSFETGTPGAVSVQTLRALVSRIAGEAHRLATGLRSPLLTELGLAAAVGEHVERWGSETGVAVDYLARNADDVELDERSTALYRIVQEALTNVARHARATRVSVILERRDGFLSAIIEDNGAGFDLYRVTRAREALSLGLLGMRERADALGGMVTIESTPGTGTTVFASVPVAES